MREMVGGINEPGNSRDGDDWDAGSSASAEAAEAISPQPGQLKPQNVKFVVSAELGELALHVSGRPPEVWQVPKVGFVTLVSCRTSLQIIIPASRIVPLWSDG